MSDAFNQGCGGSYFRPADTATPVLQHATEPAPAPEQEPHPEAAVTLDPPAPLAPEPPAAQPADPGEGEDA